ncbi:MULTISPECIES: RagB/SusD family nutrient uptake outer membrane protein [unclassified Sphingobacterium]|uniref:RagB/SusD family nutrient uptake outer membrane protein n=1 Tax=unclassified Sphingobacterium TaxID=2609468 RepID=UPI0025CFFCC3|nr:MULTISPECIES: RagB/SusD family nutrient uptake outer membrane protein [unclassified Sphingobacterium]
MKKNYIIIMLVLAISCLCACKKFLDVKPEDKVLETELFATKAGINSVLNGLYIDLASNSLYGENLTLSTVDILAQRYNVADKHNLNKIGTYSYNESVFVNRLDAIWKQSYGIILNTNIFLKNLDKYKGVLDDRTERIYMGEAYAMRAFLHFDLLRLFGPRYDTADSTKESLPYNESDKTIVNPLLPANEFIQKVIDDLNKAEELLQQDDIVTNGVKIPRSEDKIDFLRDSRNYRLNYYAVKGLKARVFLYRKDKENALKSAKEVIAVANIFPWTTSVNVLNEKQNPDRVFSTEMLFGIMNTQLYDNYLRLFDPALTDQEILAPVMSRIAAVYESNENDYRYNLNWNTPTSGLKQYRTFIKYADIVDKTKSFRYTIPLLKISEIYLIAAESESVVANSISFINTVRVNRGLTNLANNANINTELQKEYQKDFPGEGQLFYFYKRRNITSIPNGSSAGGNVNVNYNIPLPDSETFYRQ